MTPREQFDTILEAALAGGASDVHLVPGQAPRLRIEGTLRPHGAAWSGEQTEALARALFGERRLEQQSRDGVVRMSLALPGDRFARLSLASTRGQFAITTRLKRSWIPTLDRCDVPAAAAQLLSASHGLILVTGPHGSGKTTTLYALADELNRTRELHLCTVEDPIELVIEPKRALVQQREVGADVPDVAAGISAALEQDLDVLMIGELTDLESVSAALHAAETGHLVLVQVHADDAWDALERLVEATPSSMHGMVRRSLAASLLGVTSQRLVASASGGRRAAVGVLLPDEALRAALASGGSVAGQGGAPDSVTVRESLQVLETSGAVTPEVAAKARASLPR